MPNRPVGRSSKLGAWELAVRYSTLDLADGTVSGGEIDSVNVTLNWLLNAATRLMASYVDGDAGDGGSLDALLVRFQIEF